MTWETVIGLEVHVQLKTQSKAFSGASTAFGASPNTQASIIDLGMPGVLPVLNKRAVEMALVFGLAVNAKINKRSVFARKNYFYPDLPKGYQISQFEIPIVGEGELKVLMDDDTEKTIRLERAHMEEDAGKSMHDVIQGMSGIDLNRAGTPLLEIVSKPDMRSAKEAVAYLKTLHQLVCYLDICDGNLQEGSFRCDANVSVRKKGEEKLNTRVELKNINSFRFVEKAIIHEAERQIELIESGGTVKQETRLYDPDKNETRAMRSKEEANDYRYFPDPDLLPLIIDDAFLQSVKDTLPELPEAKRQRLVRELGLSLYDAGVLSSTRAHSDYFEAVLASLGKDQAKLAANWVMGDLSAALNKENLEFSESKVDAKSLAALLQRIVDNTISGKIAKTVFEIMWQEGLAPDTIIEQKGLKQVSDTGLIEKVIDEVIAAHPEQLAALRNGKDALFGFFVGTVMKQTKGKANPAQVNELLKKKLYEK